MAIASMSSSLPKAARSSEGPARGPDADLTAVLVRRGPHRSDDVVDPDDVTAGKWLDAAVQLYGGPVAFAEHIGVDLSYLTKMRAGTKPIAGRHIVKLRGETEAVLAFVAPLLESISYVAKPIAGPTRAQVAEAVLADLERDGLGRQLIDQAGERRGWDAERVAMGLRNEVTK
jgi:hypothetical protein